MIGSTVTGHPSDDRTARRKTSMQSDSIGIVTTKQGALTEPPLSPQSAQTIRDACSGFKLDDMEEDFLDQLIDAVSVAHLVLERESKP